jgi:DeoR/GlpR family transcriptional regulator of sugar metabolism
MFQSQQHTPNTWQPHVKVKILKYIRDNPDSTKADIVGALGNDERTIRRWLRAYEKNGIIVSYFDGVIKRYVIFK